MTEIRGATAVVTGAASGIGLALSRELLRRGARVVLADVERAALDAATDELGTLGEALPVVVDVRDPAAIDALAARTEEAFGPAELVFPNAGVGASGAIWDMTLDDWNWVLGVNVMGVANMVRVFVPRLIASGRPGHVCITGSLAGYLNQPGYGAYNASKHAVIAIAETLAGDLREAGHPIGVTVVAPWFVTTNFGRSNRNRPPDLAETAPPSALMRHVGERLAAVKDTSQEPELVAAMALDAVAHDRFSVFPFEPSKAAIRARFETVLDGDVMGMYLPG